MILSGGPTATRNHLWLTNGLAAYSELLWTEHTAGPGALEQQFRDDAVEALTVDNVPIIQSARMEDYSPELWALTGSKGAAVLHMLRFVVGDQPFMQILKEFATRYTWKSATTEDFKKVAQDVSKQDLGYFFIQWIESSGAPEFKLEYTIYRTQKGFRVMGKVAQDLDTFRMPVDLKIETEGNPEEKHVEGQWRTSRAAGHRCRGVAFRRIATRLSCSAFDAARASERWRSKCPGQVASVGSPHRAARRSTNPARACSG